MTLRQCLTGTGFLVIQPLILNVISIPVYFYISKTLGPTSFGQWTASQTLILTAMFLTNLGLRMQFVRSVSRNPETAEEALADQLSLRLLLASVAALVAVGACVCLRYPPVVLGCTAIGAVGLIFMSAAAACADLFQALQKLQRVATINMIAGLILTGASIPAIVFQMGPLGLALAYLLNPVVMTVLSLYMIRRHHFPVRLHWNQTRFIDMLKQARILGFQLCIGQLGERAEALLIPKLVNFTQNGLFSMGTMLSSRLTIVPDGLTTAFYPIISKSHVEGRGPFMRDLRRYFVLSLGLTLLVVLVGIALANPVAVFFFRKKLGTDWQSIHLVQSLIRITIWSIPLLGLTQFLGYTLNAIGHEALEAKLASAATLSGLALSIFLISRFGIIGACWSLVGKYAFHFVIRLPFFLHILFFSRPPVVVPAPQPE